MKILLSLTLFSLLCITAGCQSVYDVKFTSTTRGYNKEIFITPKKITFHEENAREVGKGEDFTRAIEKQEWKKLLESLDGVLLREIPLLKAPSDKRTYDGARASTIIITDKKGKSWHHAFDDEEPHAQLKPLMNQILELAKSKK